MNLENDPMQSDWRECGLKLIRVAELKKDLHPVSIEMVQEHFHESVATVRDYSIKNNHAVGKRHGYLLLGLGFMV